MFGEGDLHSWKRGMGRSAGTGDAGVVLDVTDTLSVGGRRRVCFYGFHDLLIEISQETERKEKRRTL